MEVGQVTESGEREASMSAPQEVVVRHSAPPQPTSTLNGSYDHSSTSDVRDAPPPTSSNVWAGAISRIQTQVSLNTSMLESHRQKVSDLETAMQHFQSQMKGIDYALREVQTELRANQMSAGATHHDFGDLEVLVGQVNAVTSKANEIDGLKMQLELLKNRLKRFEEQGFTGPSGQRPVPASTHHDHEVPPPPPSVHYPPPHQIYHQSLPPIRTSSTTSPTDSRSATLHALPSIPHVPTLEPQRSHGYDPAPESRRYSGESPAPTMQAPLNSSFGLSEPLPSPSTLSGWRPANVAPHPGTILPPAPPLDSTRRQETEPEARTTGWASVNLIQPTKRPLEEPRLSPYQSPITGSQKRPKLAPIMPRSSYADESHVPSSVTQSGTTDSPFNARSCVPSDVSRSQSYTLPTLASAQPPGHRFIVSTAQGDSQESWPPEAERMMHMHHHHGYAHHALSHVRSRGRGKGSRGGRRGRGRGSLACPPESQEPGMPEWKKSEWTDSQRSSNGYYDPMHHYSPTEASRGGIVRRSGGTAGGPIDREMEFPATPLAVQGPYDPFTVGHPDSSSAQQTSGDKKSRTKPIRNSEGVLIRKDGRPDMRSVSSANNLRKVHAKKEAEKAEMEGRTPTSARSLAPAHSSSLSDDENATGSPGTPADAGEAIGEENTQERHRKFMSTISALGIESKGRALERFFPRHDLPKRSEVVKEEPQGDEYGDGGSVLEREGEAPHQDTPGHMTDAMMPETSDAQAEDHAQRHTPFDTGMATVQEANEEQETQDEQAQVV